MFGKSFKHCTGPPAPKFWGEMTQNFVFLRLSLDEIAQVLIFLPPELESHFWGRVPRHKESGVWRG
jgi:hypothetical protein